MSKKMKRLQEKVAGGIGKKSNIHIIGNLKKKTKAIKQDSTQNQSLEPSS